MAEDSAAVHDAALIDLILPLVAGLPERLRAGIDVADVGCGSGHAINLMAQAFPTAGSSATTSPRRASARRAGGAALGLANAKFEVRDVAALDGASRFDLITAFDAIHDQAHPAQVLAAIADGAAAGRRFLMVDIQASSNLHENLEHPLGPFLYTVSTCTA